MKITQENASLCFVIQSTFTAAVGLLFVGPMLIDGFKSLSLSNALFCSSPFFCSAVCAWAAHSLLKSGKSARWVATTAWVLMGLVTVYVLVEMRVRDPESDLAAIVFLSTESAIAVHLLQRMKNRSTFGCALIGVAGVMLNCGSNAALPADYTGKPGAERDQNSLFIITGTRGAGPLVWSVMPSQSERNETTVS